ncbi:MAG: hypothetical protein GY869_05920, partial [Planctomycetes bacterium]|nr:hypothetical protein [Planctomycetota bacterium]
DIDEGAIPGDTLSITVDGWPAPWEEGSSGIPQLVTNAVWDVNGAVHDIDLRVHPFPANHSPAPNETGVDSTTSIQLDLLDDCPGFFIDDNTLYMTVNNVSVTPDISAIANGYHLDYNPAAPFAVGDSVEVFVQVQNDNSTLRECYSFVVNDSIRITTLAVTDTTFRTVTLEWTAIGADGYFGTPSAYDIRYSGSPITSADFLNATPVPNSLTPLPAGSVESFVVDILNPNTTYYFAIKVIDDTGRYSALSNVVSATTWPRTNIAYLKPTIASAQVNPSSNAVDGVYNTDWNAGTDQLPQDITVIFQGLAHIDSIALLINQDLTAYSAHDIYVLDQNNNASLVHDFSGTISQSQWLEHTFDSFLTGVAKFNVVTTSSPEFPSWFEIEVFGYIYAIGDTIPPARITNLAVSPHATDPDSIILSWTAPGDDSTYGQASEYDLRYNDQAINDFNFYTSTRISIPTPNPAGSGESVTIPALEPCYDYFFAIITHDEVPNLSELSDMITACPEIDSIAPATINDLAITGVTHNSISLAWTAPADDGNDPSSGSASFYDLRYSLSPITARTDFDNAIPADPQPIPGTPGSSESYTITDLDSGTHYYFAIKAGDEIPNWSDLSNSADDMTEPPPLPVCEVIIFEVTLNSVNLAWRVAGTNSTSGTVDGYKVCYSTDPITETNFDQLMQCSYQLATVDSGGWEFLLITGLEDSTQYYFAVEAFEVIDDDTLFSAFCEEGTATIVTQLTRQLGLESTSDDIETVYLSGPGFDGIELWTNRFQPVRSWRQLSLIPDSTYVLAMRVSDVGGPSGAHLTSLSDPATGEIIFNTRGDGTWKYSYYYLGSEWNFRDFDDSEWAAEEVVANYGEGYPPIIDWVDISADWIWGIPFEHYELWIRKTFSVSSIIGDVNSPAVITDLEATALSSNHVWLTWTAPGDNGLFGRGEQYDIRYATFEMDEVSFFNANEVLDEPQPDWGGEIETFLISELDPNTTYYFAIRTADEFNNWSQISPNATATTDLPPDVTAPTQINNLTVINTGEMYATLSWAAPTDTTIYGNTQAASYYEIYYADYQIDETNFQTANRLDNPLTPADPGIFQTYAVSSLVPGTTYWFLIRSSDLVGNWSLVSNTASGQTDEEFIPENLCLNKPTTTSANNINGYLAVDGDAYTQWNSQAFYSQWIEIDLLGSATIDSIAFKAAQIPSGMAIHQVYFIHGDDSVTLAHTFSGFTAEGEYLTYRFQNPPTSVKYIRVETILSPAIVAWYEIQAFGSIDINNIPPAAITDLNIYETNYTYIGLTWTAPGADSLTGQASYYDVRYATFAITAENFAIATSAINEQAPGIAGTTEFFEVDGLAPETHYYFVIKTSDEQFNWSQVSNVVDTLTTPGLIGCIIDEDICQDTNWTTDCNPYFVNNDIVICSDATLTIQPGVHVRFSSGRTITVQSGGAIQAYGDETDQITMESGTLWNGLIFESDPAPSLLQYIDFTDVDSKAIQLSNGDNLTIDNCYFDNADDDCIIYLENASPTISNNTLEGAICSNNGTCNPVISGNTFDGSGLFPVSVGAMTVFENNNFSGWGSGSAIRIWSTDITGDTFWSDINSFPYYFQGDITIFDDAVLTIEPGTDLNWVGDAQLRIGKPESQSHGSLSAVGTANQPIQFRGDLFNTSVNWGGIAFSQYTGSSSLDNCRVQDAVQNYEDSYQTAISVDQTDNVAIQNCTIFAADGVHAILLNESSLSITDNTLRSTIYAIDNISWPSISGNTFIGSGTYPITMGAMGYLSGNSFSGWSGAAGIQIWPTEITQNTTWTYPSPLPYRVQGDIVVLNEAVFMVNAGVNIQWATGSQLQVGDPDASRREDPAGSLQISGTSGQNCNLTSFSNNPDLFWLGINFTSAATNSWLHHTNIYQAYGFYNSSQFYSVLVDDTEEVYFNQVDISPAGGVNALLLNQTSIVFENGTLRGPLYCAESSGAPTIRNTAFAGNGQYPIVMGAMTHLINNNFNSWQNGENIKVWGTVINESVTWPDVNSLPYYVAASLFVGNDQTFSIDAGTQVQWADESALFVGDRTEMTPGSLDINGTADFPVQFSAYDNDYELSWYGLYFTEYAINSTSDYLNLSNAKNPVGNNLYAAARFFGTSEDIVLNRCTFNQVEDVYPIYLEDSSPTIQSCTLPGGDLYAVNATSGVSNPIMIGNTFIGQGDFPFQVGAMSTVHPNNYDSWEGEIGVKFLSTIINQPTNWADLESDIGPYYLFGTIICQSSLTISPGVTALFDNEAALKATNGGSIQAIGNSSDEGYITFSGIEGDIGTWSGIQILDSAAASHIAYSLIQFAGDVYP